MKHADYLLIGGGLASATAAETLRLEGASGSIVMIAREDCPPYHRPPLSKEFLTGEVEAGSLAVLPADYYAAHGIELMLSTNVLDIDPSSRQVTTDRAGTIGFGKALIATGADPIGLSCPGATLAGVYALRTLAQARQLRAVVKPGQRVVIVGASVLGMEAASTLSKIGLRITIIERRDAIFANFDAPDMKALFFDRCRELGLEIILSDEVAKIEGKGKVSAVLTSTGRRIACDLIVLAIGVLPNIDCLGSSGIICDNGICVDRFLSTNVGGIYAAGDVANFYDSVFDTRRRAEHWDNAIKQGRLAARNMLGQTRVYDEVSYFFSEWFDFNFQFIGESADTDEQIIRGSLASGSYARFFLKNGVLRALFSMGRPSEETNAAQALIRSRTNLANVKSRLDDPNFALQSIPNQTVLVLQGGGAMGGFGCGVVQALEAADIHPNVVAGVSIGAFNGAIIASHPGKAGPALEAFWHDLIVDTPPFVFGDFQAAMTSWQILSCGVPNFFRPRWAVPGQNPATWLSFYDCAPVKALLEKYVDFPALRGSPVRLLVSAVNVETGQLEIFDSYERDLTADHIVASGSLPPGFGWTTIEGQHYWDGGILSNSPLDQVVEKCGTGGKKIYIVDLYSQMRSLPRNMIEVQARRDEIVFAERTRNALADQEQISDYRKLIQEMLANMSDTARQRIVARPLFTQLMGEVAPIEIIRFIRAGVTGESASRDYDFSRQAIERNIHDGFEQATRQLREAAPKAAA
jgi:NADPH-dependent 2,4-dienoyl-CoA reductase/sulfur reductase-like enzyme/predicted acylesterase/phospholipase RssA